MSRVALVYAAGKGGVSTIVNNIIRGLSMEISLRAFEVPGRIPKRGLDLALLGQLRDYDIVIYMGNVAPLSALSDSFRKILFIHGIFSWELRDSWIYGNFRRKFVVAYDYVWDAVVNRRLAKIDLFVCHSVTPCEVNKVPLDKRVILPLFVFDEDFIKYSQYEPVVSIPKVVAYTSYALSSRLLPKVALIKIAKALSLIVKKRFVFLVVDPNSSPQILRYGNGVVYIVRELNRERFIMELASSTVYLDTLLDEELRNASLESGLVSTPLAKLTLPQYWQWIDYSEKEVILASSFEELIYKLAECLKDHIDCKQRFGLRYREFIRTHRTWDVVKRDFIERVKVLAE